MLFKAECLQTTGAFKLRGATNFIQRALAEDRLPDYIVANSLAITHKLLLMLVQTLTRCDDFWYENISAVKAQSTIEYGADLRLFRLALKRMKQLKRQLMRIT